MNTNDNNESIINNNYKSAIYLIACAINSTFPDDSYFASVDQGSLYDWAVSQNVNAMLGWVLSQTEVGEMTDKWKRAFISSVRKTMLFDAERENILSLLEEKKIWHTPLKGILIKDLYPVYGMRQMADNDILYDSSCVDVVKGIFLNSGYECKSFGQTNNDVYFKSPYFSFEMHRSLFPTFSPYYDYYYHVKDRLIQDPETEYRFHFTREDFYIYIYLHFAKHLHGCGTGIRSLIDLYLYRSHNPDLDNRYISRELSRFQLDGEETFIQTICCKLFSSPLPDALSSLTLDEQDFITQFLCNGTYGTIANSVSNRLKEYHETSLFARKLHYIKDRILPDAEQKLPFYPAFFRKNKWALPLFFIYRIINRLLVSRKKLWEEIKALFSL